MFNLAYAEIAEDDQSEARSQEYQALQYSIDVMVDSSNNNQDIPKRIKAIFDTSNVWTLLMEDLASPENQFPKELKAALISIGIYILKHLQAMRSDQAMTFDPIIEISKTIKEGLK